MGHRQGMRNLISVSRRTDVPAFYGRWFLNRLSEGFAGWENPFGGQKALVSLRAEEVTAFAFWSKNVRPFLPVLKLLKQHGFPVFFNYTITGLPPLFERQCVDADDAVDSLGELAGLFSPEHINWRYDPIVISGLTPPSFHERRFAELCGKLRGKVSRCCFSYAVRYGKVARSFQCLEAESGVAIQDPPQQARLTLARRLCEIAAAHGIEMFTCCGDSLVDGRIKRAHCLDGERISRLYYGGVRQEGDRPTRKECGCAENIDIGAYDTCPHGCVYCYANVNKAKADRAFQAHDPDSAFLGYSKEASDRFVADIAARQKETKRLTAEQLELSL